MRCLDAQKGSSIPYVPADKENHLQCFEVLLGIRACALYIYNISCRSKFVQYSNHTSVSQRETISSALVMYIDAHTCMVLLSRWRPGARITRGDTEKPK